MKLTSDAARGLAAAAITSTAIFLPTVALASAGSAATAGSPASRARPDPPVTAYVTTGSGVTPINTTTDTAGKAITAGSGPSFAIAITPNGKTAYVANDDATPGTVTPIRTATNTAGKAIKVGKRPHLHSDHPEREDRLRR